MNVINLSVISVLKFSHFLTVLIFLSSYLGAQPHLDFVKIRSGIKVEKISSALKFEKKTKSADFLFWVPEIETVETSVFNDIIFTQTNVFHVVRVYSGLTARPPPANLT